MGKAMDWSARLGLFGAERAGPFWRLRPYCDALGLLPPRRPRTFWPACDDQLAARVDADPEFLPLWAGQAAPLLRSRDDGEFMQGLIADLDRRLG